MPPKLLNTVFYSETWNVLTAGGSQAYQYRLNDIYDPFVGVGGRGVHGIDELQAIYNHYQVRRVRMRVTATLGGNGETTSLYLYSSADPTVPSIDRVDSAPDQQFALMSLARPCVLCLDVPMSRYVQNPDDAYYGAAPSTDPTKAIYGQLFMKNVSGADLNVIIRVAIEFDTEWSERIDCNDIDA